MCSSINIILIFLSCICTSKFGLGENISHKTSKSGHQHCYVKMPLLDSGYMPIPYEGNFAQTHHIMFYETVRKLEPHPSNPKVIRPDKNGYLFFKHDNSYKFTCSENEFVSLTRYPASEVTVKCSNGSFQYEGKAYEFSDFRCVDIPQSRLVWTGQECQGEKFHEIIKVGFESRNTFLDLYRICYDLRHKNALYAWYFVNPPFYKHNQNSKIKPDFIYTRDYKTDPYVAYENQTITLEKTFKRDDLLDVYKEKNPKTPFLIPGHLISKHEFAYIAEQHSTYYYENTAPQWFTFNNDVWNDFQKSFRRNLVKSTFRHLIVTGTLLTSSLKNESYIQGDELFLILPNSLAVPGYFWKMDYDLDRKSGTVFIGVNNPYKRINHNVHICDTISCPGHAFSSLSKRSELFYCCSKESFEKTYGVIDPVVYREF